MVDACRLKHHFTLIAPLWYSYSLGSPQFAHLAMSTIVAIIDKLLHRDSGTLSGLFLLPRPLKDTSSPGRSR